MRWRWWLVAGVLRATSATPSPPEPLDHCGPDCLTDAADRYCRDEVIFQYYNSQATWSEACALVARAHPTRCGACAPTTPSPPSPLT